MDHVSETNAMLYVVELLLAADQCCISLINNKTKVYRHDINSRNITHSHIVVTKLHCTAVDSLYLSGCCLSWSPIRSSTSSSWSWSCWTWWRWPSSITTSLRSLRTCSLLSTRSSSPSSRSSVPWRSLLCASIISVNRGTSSTSSSSSRPF